MLDFQLLVKDLHLRLNRSRARNHKTVAIVFSQKLTLRYTHLDLVIKDVRLDHQLVAVLAAEML
jgi:hypothetical protein